MKKGEILMKVTEDMIIQMNELYIELKTYAAVSRIVGVSPTTVKKYINPNFSKVTENKRNIEEREINFDLFDRVNWNILLELMPREKVDIEEVRKEVVL